MDDAINNLKKMGSQAAHNPGEIKGQIRGLEQHANDLKEGKISVDEVKNRLPQNNPVTNAIRSQLDHASTKEEAQNIIDKHVNDLKGALGHAA